MRMLLVAGAFAACAVPGGSAQFPAPQASPVQAPAATDLLDLNTASPTELAKLPGMGQAYARRIAEARPYSAKNQLVTRGVLPQSAYEHIKDRVVAHRPRP